MAVKGNIRKKHKKTEVSRVEETAGTDVDGKLKKKVQSGPNSIHWGKSSLLY